MPEEARGPWGERIAAEHLVAHGWTVLRRNFRHQRREIDLIARRDEVVAFVEVKTRGPGVLGHPLEAVDAHKRRTIATVANAWIAEHGSPAEVYRFDVITIVRTRTGAHRLDHLEDAWSAE